MIQTSEISALKYKKNNESFSLCIIEFEVLRFLKTTHENYEHYAAALILNFLIDRAYWSTRVKNVHHWCQTCHACQMKAHKSIKVDVQSIQVFESMTIIKMNWLRPVTFADAGTDAVYVLLVVNYFSRFVWAKVYQFHTATKVINMFQNYIASIFEMPVTVYSDNELHFVNKDVRRFFREHEVIHYIESITSFSSTELLKRTVQKMIEYLRTKSIDKGNIFIWDADVKDEVFFMNIKSVRIYEYSLSKLMLKYVFQQLHFDIKLLIQPVTKSEEVQRMKIKKALTHQKQIYLALRNERRRTISELTFYVFYYHFRRNRLQRLLKAENLIIIRHHVVDNQRERKLESRWLEPWLLIDLTSSESSNYVQKLHEDEVIKRYHLNDILFYKERETFQKKGITFEPSLRDTHSMFINERDTENSKFKAVLLSIYSY